MNEMKPITIGLILLLGLIMGACQEEPRHISGAQFQTEYEMRNQQTMHSAEFMGEREGRVFLLKKSMSSMNPEKWLEEVLFTEVTELDPSFLQRLRQGAEHR
ncbi:MAG: hypothetical protein P1P84_06235 [Deferrisomatales bacterium]|nr:hypothetical protein [Deferrisomatales bacterium]